MSTASKPRFGKAMPVRERRGIYLDIMRRRTRPGSGSSADLLRIRESYPMPDLGTLLSGVRYVVTGGTAVSLYTPLRVTKDVDVLVSASAERAAGEALGKAGAIPIGPLRFASSLGLKRMAWKLPDAQDDLESLIQLGRMKFRSDY